MHLGPNVYALSREQAKLGEEVHIICRGHGSTENFEGIYVHRVGGPYNLSAILQMIRSYSGIRNYDLIHMHATSGYLAGLSVRRLLRVPFLVHVHGSTVASTYLNEIKTPSKMWLTLSRERAAWGSADAVIAVSYNLARELVAFYKVSPSKIHVVHNAVDPSYFSPLEDRDKIRNSLGWTDRKVILYVGRISSLKGLNDLIQAGEFLSSSVKDVLIVLVGGIPGFQDTSSHQYFESLRQLVKTRGLEENITFLGPVPNSELPAIYSAADIFVLPSLSEGTPKSVLEAMSCRKPCVVSNVGGLPELVTSKEGTVVPVHNPRALAEELEAILSDENLIVKMGIAARRRILENFTWQEAARKVQKIYSKLLETN